MEVKYLQVLVMGNGEVLYLGRTLGFISENETHSQVKKEHLFTEDKIVK